MSMQSLTQELVTDAKAQAAAIVAAAQRESAAILEEARTAAQEERATLLEDYRKEREELDAKAQTKAYGALRKKQLRAQGMSEQERKERALTALMQDKEKLYKKMLTLTKNSITVERILCPKEDLALVKKLTKSTVAAGTIAGISLENKEESITVLFSDLIDAAVEEGR